MPLQYARDGDAAFIGLNSRDNPAVLGKGIVSRSENFRMDRGVATVRKGLKRLTQGALIGETVYGTGVYLDANGQEIIVIVCGTRLFAYNPQTETFTATVNYPVGETITDGDVVDVVHAIDKVYISRGFSKRPLEWNLGASIVALPTAGHQFPNCSHMLYYGNRMVVKNSRDSIQVSHYLDFTNFNDSEVFRFNDGGNDEVVGLSPWTLNEFVVLCRNSSFYCNVGTGIWSFGDDIATDAYVKSLTTDVGCAARRSVVQAGGVVLFLSDNGVYMLDPRLSAGDDSIKLLTLNEPMSAPIDDIIQRINRNFAHQSVGIYWNNRYYLAVPLDNSTSNNRILVFNFINKQWESVDSYPAGFDAKHFVVAKKGNSRRLFAIDDSAGVFLMEELEQDEYGIATGGPILPFFLPSTLSALGFQKTTINGVLDTKLFTFNDISDKRFSSLQYDLSIPTGSAIKTSIVTTNPDITTVVDQYGAAADGQDATRRVPLRKTAYGLKVRYESLALRPSIRSTILDATDPGRNARSED